MEITLISAVMSRPFLAPPFVAKFFMLSKYELLNSSTSSSSLDSASEILTKINDYYH